MSDLEELDARAAASIGRVLGRKWRLDALLGIGGMAAVYAATHRNGARAAIKLLHPEVAREPEARTRFLREAYIANRVGHPGAVSVLDDDVDGEGRPYIVMELLEGETLDARVESLGGTLPPEDALVVADAVLDILASAHGEGIVHRDIKPENVFLTRDGKTKLLDFGIARLREGGGPSLTRTGLVFGTPAFMAPEQALGRHSLVDGRTDLWAVGAILYSIVSGQPVHQGETASEVIVSAATRPPRSLARVAPSAPVALVAIVDRALQYEPSKRFASAAEMRAAIAAAFQPRVEAEPDPSPPRPSALPATTYRYSSPPPERPAGRGPSRPSALPDTTYRYSTPAPDRPSRVPRRSRASAAGAPASDRPSPATPASRQPPENDRAPDRPAPSGGGTRARRQSEGPRGESRDFEGAPGQRRPSWEPESGPPTQGRPARGSSVRSSPEPAPPAPERDVGRPAGSPERRRPAEPPAAEPPEPGPHGGAEADPLEEAGLDPAASPLLDGGVEVPASDRLLLRDLFDLLGRLLSAERQYGAGHPEATRRRRGLEAAALSALERAPAGLFWEVAPYAFVAGGEVLWEPEAPFDRIPYQLFADGVRILALLPGLEPAELARLLELLLMDRGEDMPPEDDFVTLLWEAGFDHIDFHAIDTFAEGDQDQRAAFEAARQQVVAAARRAAAPEAEACWRETRGPRASPGRGADDASRRLIARLSSGQAVDVESVAQALAFGSVESARALARLTRVDAPTALALGARLEASSEELSGRFGQAAARAYAQLEDEGDPRPVGEALRRAVDGLAEAQPLAAVDMVRSLAEAAGLVCAPAEADTRRASLGGAVVSAELLRAIWDRVRAPEEEVLDREPFVEGLRLILAHIDATHLAAVLEAFAEVDGGPLFDLLLAYVARVCRGHEAALGAVLDRIGLAQALSLVRLLADLGTAEAREAVVEATRSPHAMVRIEAIGFLEGTSSDRLREELRALLQDRDAEVRLTALALMAEHRVRVAGPFLAVRVRAPAFERLPPLEKRQSFATLAALAASRTEAICLELLEDTKLVTSAGHEETREIAAETLGLIGASSRVVAALTKASGQRWKSTERVRTAARLALDQVERRLASGGAAPPEGVP